MNAQRRTALIFVTQGVGCASCMCDRCSYVAYTIMKDMYGVISNIGN